MKIEIPAVPSGLPLGSSRGNNNNNHTTTTPKSKMKASTSLDLRRISVEESWLLQFNPSASVRTTGSFASTLAGGGGGGGGFGGFGGFGAAANDTTSVRSHQSRGTVKSSASTSAALAIEAAQKQSNAFFRAFCLRSSYGLRTQLLLSFGLLTTVTIGFVITTCIVVATIAGHSIQQIHQDSLRDYLTNIEATSARFLAEQLTPKLIPMGAVQILYEATRDRFAGYPFVTNDALVPFVDRLTETGQYPLRGPSLPLDWQQQQQQQQQEQQLEPPQFEEIVVSDDNHQEHLQHPNRWDVYKDIPFVSTSTAFYGMQGMCDPNELNPNAPKFYPDCSPDNNNLTSGGIVAPTPVNEMIHRKASDLTPVLKSIYEYHTDLKDLGIFFVNGGAGSSITFPHYQLNNSVSYVSGGCDWMSNINPIVKSKNQSSNQPIANSQEQTNCHPKGSIVTSRDYNPLERQWCSKQALEPYRIHVDGPYRDAWNEKIQLVSIGRSVYDRVTNELVACLYLGYTLSSVQQIIENTTQASYPEINGTMKTSVVRWDDFGSVVATSSSSEQEEDDENNNTSTTTTRLATIDQINVGVTPEIYKRMRDLVDYTAEWDPKDVQERYNSLRIYEDGVFLSAYPIPPVPEQYDPHYRPDFMVISSLYREAIAKHVQDINDSVDDQVQEVIFNAVIVGISGLVVVLIVIFIVSHSITMPLQQMDQKATDMLGTFGRKLNNGDDDDNDDDDDGDYYKDDYTAGQKELEKQKSSSTAPVVDTDGSCGEKSGGPQQQQPKSSTTTTISTSYCTPRTELAKLTEAFENMVSSFSGTSSMSRDSKHISKDLENNFLLGNDAMLLELYQSRQDPNFKYQVTLADNAGSGDDMMEDPFLHQGHVVRRPTIDNDTLSQETMEQPSITGSPMGSINTSKQQKKKKRFSSLFLWIGLLIGTPLLVTTIAISADVLYRISNEFLDGIEEAKDMYMDIELQALTAYTQARAKLASSLTSESVRDLHVLSRYSSWLLFGGLTPSDSFTRMTSGTELCKNEENWKDCDYVKENWVCDCAWNDVTSGDCQVYDEQIDTRYLQRANYALQNDDSYADGDRNHSSYPANSLFPNATNWWFEYSNMPGSEVGTTGRGYGTTYDRLRMVGANPMLYALYNYDIKKERSLGMYIGYEADGSFAGFNGCRSANNAKRPFWKAKESNGAARVRPELCPLGKYGYDPRCREWYGTGRDRAMEEEGALYITPPYEFASNGMSAHTATNPLTDPITREHVGQVLVDFRSDSIYRSLEEQTPLARGGFPILITPRKDKVTEAETVIGPNFGRGETAKPIVSLVLENEQNCTSTTCQANQAAFQNIVRHMQNGGTNTTRFNRMKADGSLETVYVAYAPVVVKSYRPINSSDFARGVEESEYLVYSLALAETEEGALEVFEAVEKNTEKQVYIAIGIVTIAIAMALGAVVYFSHVVASSITEPMEFLHDLITSIETVDKHDEHHKLGSYKGSGSKELVNFSVTLETLYSVVRNVNMAYYAGDLEKAYYVMSDSLRLFRRLDNKKAIGVACNNLGNILFAAVRRMKRRGEKTLFGRTLPTLVTKGVEYFTEAIRLGEKAYDDFYEAEGWTPNCLAFMQHLSNRYFNRAMFLLTVKDKHREPEELKKLGLRDLQIAFDMDVEITDQGEETGWGRVDRDQQLFEVALLRARGHILLQELGYPDDWEVEETLDRAFELLKTTASRPGQSGMFDDIGRIGRLQQIETELMRYKALKGEMDTAAKIAIRLLKEDEYVLPRAYAVAMRVVTTYVIEQKGDDEGDDDEEEDPLLYSLEIAMDDLLATLHDIQCKEGMESQELEMVRQSMQNRSHHIDATLEDFRAMDSVTMEDF